MKLADYAATVDEGGRRSAKEGSSRGRLSPRTRARATSRRVVQLLDRRDRCVLLAPTKSTSSTLTLTTTVTMRSEAGGAVSDEY
jgi:hypothetical protein